MCLNPVKLPSGMEVGCCHCLECLKQYQDMWIARINEELKSWRALPGEKTFPGVFFTLTYDNDSIPRRYLVLTRSGIYVTHDRPDCEVLRCWFDGHRNGLASKDYAVRRWREAVHHYYSPDLDFPDWTVFNQEPSVIDSLPELPPAIHCVPGDKLYKPILALEFHSVDKSDVQYWLKRCRILFERKRGSLYWDDPDLGQSVSLRFNPYWTDSEGNQRVLPSSACPKTFKYFITSEYGPSTFRPHMHGLLIGVNYDEFEEYFAPDWQAHYGNVEFSALDPTRGAAAYLSKYCSKGGYEHPYCRRDFFYTLDGVDKEFHSRSYLDVVRDFGVNTALVEPTFHLISKGLGTRYCFDAEIQKYFGVHLAEYFTPGGRRRYSCSDDIASLHSSLFPTISIREFYKEEFKCIEIDEYKDGLRIRKYDNSPNRNLIGESVIPFDARCNASVEDSLLAKQYNRTYVKFTSHLAPGIGRPGCPAFKRSTLHPKWHLIGHNCCSFETKTTSISLPRFYRGYLLSPLASLLRAGAAIRLYPTLDARVARVVQSGGSPDEISASIKSFLAADEARCASVEARLRKSTEDFLRKSTF